jgi:hypothetical protein
LAWWTRTTARVADALQLAQIREQRRHFGRVVLVDAVQADKRVQDEELRMKLADGGGEAGAVVLPIQPDGG